jgi:beta-lactamase class A
MNNSDYKRRDFLKAAAVGALAMVPAMSFVHAKSMLPSIADIETKIGGRVGVFAVDTGNGRTLTHRPDERFAMCSIFKWVLAAAILAQAERGSLSFDERVSYQQADLLQYAPVTSKHLADGMTVGDLARAAIVVSDNTAANLLLSKLGGPSAVTEFARSCGDAVTRLDRNEPVLNSNEAGDLRDTTSPQAMATLMRTVLCGNLLSSQSRDLLLQWMRDCETGHDLLRTGFPENWAVGDKTGSGQNGAINDVAIVTPPNRSPILVAAFLSEGQANTPVLRAAHVDIGRLVVRHFT